MTIHLIYIGDHFYHESKTMMSSIYTTRGQRYDWGFVQRDLAAGHTVEIRPATPVELLPYERALSEMLKREEKA